MIWCAPDLVASAIMSAIALGWGTAVPLEQGSCDDAQIVIVEANVLMVAGQAMPCPNRIADSMCGAPINQTCMITIREGLNRLELPYVINHELGHCILNTAEHRPLPSVMSGLTYGPSKDDLEEARAIYDVPV
jgi:hypothetical protein